MAHGSYVGVYGEGRPRHEVRAELGRLHPVIGALVETAVKLAESRLWRHHEQRLERLKRIGDVDDVVAVATDAGVALGGSRTMRFGWAKEYADGALGSGTVAGAFQVSGRGEFMGLHWRQHLTPLGAYSPLRIFTCSTRPFTGARTVNRSMSVLV